LDGIDIRKLEPRWLRKQFGLVSQEPVLFADTIANNISYGVDLDSKPKTSQSNDTGITQSQIECAARMANAHEFIMQLPQQYNTLAGERGALLSGGQRQRIAIARAILNNPAILLLDEATSALDNENEKQVQEALERLMNGRTAIIIAHRLSTVRNADMIAFVEEGKIIETGTHTELMQKRGSYYRCYIAQTNSDFIQEDR